MHLKLPWCYECLRAAAVINYHPVTSLFRCLFYKKNGITFLFFIAFLILSTHNKTRRTILLLFVSGMHQICICYALQKYRYKYRIVLPAAISLVMKLYHAYHQA